MAVSGRMLLLTLTLGIVLAGWTAVSPVRVTTGAPALATSQDAVLADLATPVTAPKTMR